MRDVLTHRGPDGAGAFIERHDDGSGVALGHRRLSIVDVAHGAQPMASDDGALQIVYNGEVYNHPVVQRELEREGVRYHTHSDTETVLRLYERHGHAAPERMRGMFAASQRPTVSTWGSSRVRLCSHRPLKRRSWRSR